MKFLKIIGLSLIICSLYSCSTAEVKPSGPIYCSPIADFFITKNIKDQTRRWVRDLPPLNEVKTAELGNSIIARRPYEEIYYYTFDDKDSFKGEIYKFNSLREPIVKETLNPEEILKVESVGFCSSVNWGSLPFQKIHAEILEKYSLHTNVLSSMKYKLDLGKKTKLELIGEIPEGKIYKNMNYRKYKNYREGYTPLNPINQNNNFYGVFIPNDKKTPLGILKSEDFMLPINFTVNNLKALSSINPYYDENLMTQQLIYNGRVGESVKFLYREFKGDIARTPFQQNITYDLKIGEVIGFKGARFKILKADNVSLEYEVIEHFDRLYQGN